MDKILKVALILLVSLGLTAAPAAALTATSSAGNIAISPAIQQINLSKGQTSTSFNTEVTNNSKAPVVVQISMRDFTALNETGSVSFLGKNYAGNNLHGLANWMHTTTSSLALASGASMAVPVTISDTTGLAPGGHYGAVVYRVVPAAPNNGKSQLMTNEEVSVLVFLTTYGGRTQAVTLHKPELNTVFTAMPSTVNLDFANTGNTQTTPHGIVTITDNRNKEVARGIINVESGLVLPSTNRLYQVSLTYAKKTFHPGSYQIHVSYQAGDSATTHTFVKHFLYINRSFIVATMLIALLAILFFIYRVSRHYGKYKVKP